MNRFAKWLVTGEDPKRYEWEYMPEYLYHFTGNATLLFYAAVIVWIVSLAA